MRRVQSTRAHWLIWMTLIGHGKAFLSLCGGLGRINNLLRSTRPESNWTGSEGCKLSKPDSVASPNASENGDASVNAEDGSLSHTRDNGLVETPACSGLW
jgi:hypothetical protein